MSMKENVSSNEPSIIKNETFFDFDTSGTVFTLRARDYKDPQVVVLPKTYDARGNGGGDISNTITGGHQSTISDYTAIVIEKEKSKMDNQTEPRAVVRRLTPLECERLQGFPDNWTNIGDWVDSNGKKHSGAADAPRYKALGNSIALPYWEWLAGRMVAQLKADGVENPTMASLFDGIGGFPLVYSRCGCEPVWASEIEEFPIAVTKYHFPDNDEE